VFRRELPGGQCLRLLDESDADELVAVVQANHEHLAEWLPWVTRDYNAALALDFIRRSRAQLAENNGFQATIVEGGAIIGMTGFHAVSWEHRSTGLGYWLAAGAQGRGVMTEAVRTLVDHAFDHWELNRVEIRAAVENARSRAIPGRLGFREEGVLRQVELVRGGFLDHVVYSMLAAEWTGGARGA